MIDNRQPHALHGKHEWDRNGCEVRREGKRNSNLITNSMLIDYIICQIVFFVRHQICGKWGRLSLNLTMFHVSIVDRIWCVYVRCKCDEVVSLLRLFSEEMIWFVQIDSRWNALQQSRSNAILGKRCSWRVVVRDTAHDSDGRKMVPSLQWMICSSSCKVAQFCQLDSHFSSLLKCMNCANMFRISFMYLPMCECRPTRILWQNVTCKYSYETLTTAPFCSCERNHSEGN